MTDTLTHEHSGHGVTRDSTDHPARDKLCEDFKCLLTRHRGDRDQIFIARLTIDLARKEPRSVIKLLPRDLIWIELHPWFDVEIWNNL